MTFRPLITAEEATARLEVIFPRAAFDSIHSNPLAGAAVAAMIYVDAIAPPDEDPPAWARPSTCTWMSDAVLSRHDTDEERVAWRAAAERNKDQVTALLATWGEEFQPRYADNTRETLRDETFSAWREHGALRQRFGLATSSGLGRWALTASFADLFLPSLTGAELDIAVEAWRDTNMSPGPRLRALRAADRARQEHEILVHLPGDTVRHLEPGDASLILKGVIEEWAPNRLRDPVVITISEPGDKIFTGDAQTLHHLGVSIDPSRVLPDALLADLGQNPVIFWLVEAVASDGPITEERRRRLLEWANDQNIDPSTCRFLTAFISRSDNAARRRLKDLAVGTFAYYADEPGRELHWYEIT